MVIPLESFCELLDEQSWESCFQTASDCILKYNIDSISALLLELVFLRTLQASHSRLDNPEKISFSARQQSRKIFQYLNQEIVNLDASLSKLNLASILYYIKPESTVFAELLIKYFSSRISPSHKTEDLYSYARNFLEYSQFGITPSQHYLNGKKIALAGKEYFARVMSKVNKPALSSPSHVNILVGCSTADAIAFHPDCRYDYVISIPGLRIFDLNEPLILDLITSLGFTIVNKCRVQIDLMIGFCDVTTILNSHNISLEGYPSQLSRLCDLFNHSQNIILGFQHEFSPINQRLLQYPSVCGIIKSSEFCGEKILSFRDMIKSMALQSQISPFQTISFLDQCFFDSSALIHDHEIHMKLNSNISSHILM